MKELAEVMHSFQRMYFMRKKILKKNIESNVVSWELMPVISYIKKNPMCNQREIADALGITPAAITQSTQKLEKLGMLEKVVDENNLRCKRLSVTKKGEETVNNCIAGFDEIDKIMFDGIEKKELKKVKAMFEKMIINLLDYSGMEEPTAHPWD